jgi:hypothetical protein
VRTENEPRTRAPALRFRAAWVAWSVFLLYWLFAAVGRVFEARLKAINGPTQEGDLPTLMAFAAFGVVGAVITSRRPRNAIGWIFLASLLCAGLSYAGPNYANYAFVPGGEPMPAAGAVAWLASWSWYPTLGLIFTFLLLLFPDGRLPGPRWKWVAWSAAVSIAAVVLSIGLRPGPYYDSHIPLSNPLGVEALGGFMDPLQQVGGILLVGSALASAASLVVRFHKADRDQRQQIKWFTYAGAINVCLILLSILFPSLEEALPVVFDDFLFAFGISLLPIAVGVAVLRYHLYDIDILINRTLVYATLTAALGLAYFGSVVLLQAAFRALTGRESQLAVVASTLAIAALFGPLRRRIQAFIDRRFYRRKYDAARVLAAFSARLRDEVDLDALRDDLVTVVGETVQPAHASLWLRPTLDVRRSTPEEQGR